ncbi:MAG TPA: LegC family aminotransferase [Gemmatimonadales bacterium]|nr:LegC family aminotransferase [Gemmatimonadales bacterium]
MAEPNTVHQLHEPVFEGNESAYLQECVRTGWVSSAGAFVDRFEAELARLTGVRRAVAVVNGTAALHICLRLAGVEPEDEVLVPSLTFVGTVNAIAYCGAIPHFVDSSHLTLGLDPGKLDDYLNTIAARGSRNRHTGRVLRAVLPMHTYGHPVDLDALKAVCDKYDLVLVEDAAESIGSYYKGRHTGSLGRLGALSFNGNKTITTGGGGAVLTNDDGLGQLAKHLTTTAKVAHRWAFNHDMVGYNYRLPNLNAALGCAQLEQLAGFVEAKRELARRYAQAFCDIPEARFFVEPPFATSNYWLNVMLLDPTLSGQRDAILEATNAAGLMTRPAWTLMHKLPMYASAPRMDLSVAEDLEQRLINLPSGVRTARGAGRARA